MHGRYLLPTILAAVILAVPIVATTQGTAAQGVAEYVTIEGGTVSDGDIVILSSAGYELAASPYDDRIYGVVTLQPAVAWGRVPRDESHAVVHSGTAMVRVSAANGALVSGDWITSSLTPGVGMKATQPGFALGRALEPSTADTDNSTILVTIDPQFVSSFEASGKVPLTPGDIIATLRYGYQVATSGAANFSVRYLLAVAALLISLIFAYLAFIRTASNSVLAVGRNPLARRSIIVIAAFNVVIAITIVAAGLALALFILAL